MNKTLILLANMVSTNLSYAIQKMKKRFINSILALILSVATAHQGPGIRCRYWRTAIRRRSSFAIQRFIFHLCGKLQIVGVQFLKLHIDAYYSSAEDFCWMPIEIFFHRHPAKFCPPTTYLPCHPPLYLLGSEQFREVSTKYDESQHKMV